MFGLSVAQAEPWSARRHAIFDSVRPTKTSASSSTSGRHCAAPPRPWVRATHSQYESHGLGLRGAVFPGVGHGLEALDVNPGLRPSALRRRDETSQLLGKTRLKYAATTPARAIGRSPACRGRDDRPSDIGTDLRIASPAGDRRPSDPRCSASAAASRCCRAAAARSGSGCGNGSPTAAGSGSAHRRAAGCACA